MKRADFWLFIRANKQQSLNLQLAKNMGPACAEPNYPFTKLLNLSALQA